MGRNNNNNVLGTGNNNRGKCCNRVSPVEDIVHPTRTVVRTTTNERRVRNIHPTEVINVNRTVIRNENFFPVTERQVNETVVEDFDCGSDVNNSNNCRPRRFF
ncbi:CotD family spore coat protein [Niallia sp.]|uniref:CotD family spore coat protein n=1 Tax=Niallia sp. TaxID=2837523 RepID=UPI00289EBC4C|nr:CotD family spore coat protein [Niallia sp.]